MRSLSVPNLQGGAPITETIGQIRAMTEVNPWKWEGILEPSWWEYQLLTNHLAMILYQETTGVGRVETTIDICYRSHGNIQKNDECNWISSFRLNISINIHQNHLSQSSMYLDKFPRNLN